jgi:haloacetate dehalogenase
MYNVLATWQERAKEVEGKPLPTGHFLPEQVPQELTAELRSFLRA